MTPSDVLLMYRTAHYLAEALAQLAHDIHKGHPSAVADIPAAEKAINATAQLVGQIARDILATMIPTLPGWKGTDANGSCQGVDDDPR